MLKGGLLLAAFDARRPTADVDLLATDVSTGQATISALVGDIARVTLPDTSGTIREDVDYTGVRVGMDATVASAHSKLRLDVKAEHAVGDIRWWGRRGAVWNPVERAWG